MGAAAGARPRRGAARPARVTHSRLPRTRAARRPDRRARAARTRRKTAPWRRPPPRARSRREPRESLALPLQPRAQQERRGDRIDAAALIAPLHAALVE